MNFHLAPLKPSSIQVLEVGILLRILNSQIGNRRSNHSHFWCQSPSLVLLELGLDTDIFERDYSVYTKSLFDITLIPSTLCILSYNRSKWEIKVLYKTLNERSPLDVIRFWKYTTREGRIGVTTDHQSSYLSRLLLSPCSC